MPTDPEQRVAFIGLGRMGRPMAQRLIAAGYIVRGYDVSAPAAEAARRVGISLSNGAAEAVRGSAIVITMLPDPSAVEACLNASDGPLTALDKDAVWLEMTSSHPEVTRSAATAAARRGGSLLDAPVSGGVKGAREGTLAIACAGARSVFDAAEPLLRCLGSRIVHISERPGDGDMAKTINNLLSAVNLTVAAEGLVLGLAAGLDPERLLEYVNAGSGSSNATEVKLPHYVLTGSFDSGFTLGQYAKDLGIARAVADAEGLTLPVSKTAIDLWCGLSADRGDDDHTEVVRLIAAMEGLGDSLASRRT